MRLHPGPLGLMVGCWLAACTGPASGTLAEKTAAQVEVTVVVAQRTTVPLRTELPGRITPRRVAEVRARAHGILLKRTFEEGSDVRQGQVLFRIDPAPLSARLDSANATLRRAQANLQQMTTLTQRYAALGEAVSRQEVDDGEAIKQQREAEVLQARAALRTAELELGYATVRAPISGRIGKAWVTEGALVSNTEATRMAVIQQLDPVYFDFEQSGAALLALRRKLEGGEFSAANDEPTQLTLLLDDDSEYPHRGKLLFSDVTVDERTGMVTVRAEVPNPDLLLLPGMFARARIDQAMTQDAITLPQRSVALGPAGNASVLVVNDAGKVEQVAISIERAVRHAWVVTSGIEAGTRVILEGRQKVRPGDSVHVVEFSAPRADR